MKAINKIAAIMILLSSTITSQAQTKNVKTGNSNPLAEVYSAYFALKDALTKDDVALASSEAKNLF
ncbi:MAG: DUF3347 domain-containing protein, partial [Bacteroidetes bacterium]|nr:DUF3347 domain-containing protein [Bacteroidota bacterium]